MNLLINRLWLDHDYLKEKLKKFDIFLTKELFEKHDFKLVEEYKTYFRKQLNTIFSNENIAVFSHISTTKESISFDIGLRNYNKSDNEIYHIESFAFNYIIESKKFQIKSIFYNIEDIYEVCIFYKNSRFIELAFFMRETKSGKVISSERFYINILESNDVEIKFSVTHGGALSNYIEPYQTSVEMLDVICKILHLKQSTTEEKEHEILLYDKPLNGLIFCKPLETFKSLYHEENVIE